TELDHVHPVSPADHADAFAPRLPRLATRGREHAESGRRPNQKEREHRRAQPPTVPRRANEACVLRCVLRGSVTHVRDMSSLVHRRPVSAIKGSSVFTVTTEVAPMRWVDGGLLVLDQRRLPDEEAWIRCETGEPVTGLNRFVGVSRAP